MIEKLKKLLDENNISQEDQQKIIKGFKYISFQQRKSVFGVLEGHPELIQVFVSLINKKIDLVNGLSDQEADLIIEEEKNLLKESLKDI
ncbi:hypothetical protein D4R87_00980 [bacterium]|nr:MAG: hypothetical protein D4R87_00980 [bacterium]